MLRSNIENTIEMRQVAIIKRQSLKKMSRKRYVKQLMSWGAQRNLANAIADRVRDIYRVPYSTAYWISEFSFEGRSENHGK